MLVSQVSVYLENQKGRITEVCRLLKEQGIRIEALSIWDTTDPLILRMVADKPDRAVAVLKAKGFAVGITQVLAVGTRGWPGGLPEVISRLEENGVGIEYLYAAIAPREDKSDVLMKVEDPHGAMELLRDSLVL